MTRRLAADAAGIEEAAALLRAGRLVAFGTETVYGLGADATNAEAVAAVFAAKGRPRFNPLICHFPQADAAFAHVAANDTARTLARALAHAFWPGPLTLVLPRAPGTPIALLAGAGLPTLAVRVPGPDLARALLTAAGRPVAAPSANPSGTVSPTTAFHVLDGLAGRIDAVLDTGPCPVGLESTILDLTQERPHLLRLGGIALADIEQVAGPVARHAPPPGAAPTAPGQLASHYAPSLPLRLEAASVGPDEALLAFGPPLTGTGAVWNLSPACDLREAAARLFEGLRVLDSEGRRRRLRGIAAMRVPEEGLGAAINDRLRRAAAPRSSGT